MSAEIDTVIRESLTSFLDHVRRIRLPGREHEAISLYTLCHLIRFVRPGTFLHDPAQICIQGAVPKAVAVGPNKNQIVNKDLIIWSEPHMTCWDAELCPVVCPSVILEWKVRHRLPHSSRATRADDVAKLRTLTSKCPEMIGYSVLLDLRHAPEALSCLPIRAGMSFQEWEIG